MEPTSSKQKRRHIWKLPGDFPILATSHLVLTDSLITVVCQGTKSPSHPANQKPSVFCLEYVGKKSKQTRKLCCSEITTKASFTAEVVIGFKYRLWSFIMFNFKHDSQSSCCVIMSDFQSYSNNGLFDLLNGFYRNTVPFFAVNKIMKWTLHMSLANSKLRAT